MELRPIKISPTGDGPAKLAKKPAVRYSERGKGGKLAVVVRRTRSRQESITSHVAMMLSGVTNDKHHGSSPFPTSGSKVSLFPVRENRTDGLRYWSRECIVENLRYPCRTCDEICEMYYTILYYIKETKAGANISLKI